MAREEDFEIAHEIFRLGICVAHIDDDIVVEPYGYVYPCRAFTRNPLYIKGKLKENETVEFNGEYTGYQARNVWRGKCNNYPYLPLCMGAVESSLF